MNMSKLPPIVGITIFTVVEVIWIVYLFPSLLHQPLGHQLIAGLILETEHALAFNVGARLPLFDFAPLFRVPA